MNRPLFSAGLLAMILAFSAIVIADPTSSAPADTQASAAPATSNAPVALASNDNAAILEHVGNVAAITGRVDKVSATSSGSITFINFVGNERGDFVAIIKQENLDAINKAFAGNLAKAITGKKITITGAITKFRNTPQIEVTKPEQLTILDETPATATKP